MGYNAVIFCERHKKYVYMMRGEEPLDLQRLMRTEHRECMKVGSVKLICDADTDIGDQNSDYTEFWPYEERPKITGVVPEE